MGQESQGYQDQTCSDKGFLIDITFDSWVTYCGESRKIDKGGPEELDSGGLPVRGKELEVIGVSSFLPSFSAWKP
jgi:hypothetical protein